MMAHAPMHAKAFMASPSSLNPCLMLFSHKKLSPLSAGKIWALAAFWMTQCVPLTCARWGHHVVSISANWSRERAWLLTAQTHCLLDAAKSPSPRCVAVLGIQRTYLTATALRTSGQSMEHGQLAADHAWQAACHLCHFHS